MKVKDEIKEIGFNDSYYSEGFKEGIPIINSLLKKYGLKIHTCQSYDT